MSLEDVLENVNYNIEKIVVELRKRIEGIPGITETVDKSKIIYQYSGKNFCLINIKKDYLEIDFKIGNDLVDPVAFSWKIGRTKRSEFDNRMHMKNIFDIDVVFNIISQSYNYTAKNRDKSSSNQKYRKKY